MQPVEPSTWRLIRVLLLAVVLGVMVWMLWPSRPAHLPQERAGGDAAGGTGAAVGEASATGETAASEVAGTAAGGAAAVTVLLTGRVVRGDDESPVPVAGALVRLSPQPPAAADPFDTEARAPVPDAGGFARREVRTGEDGRFSFDGIPRRAELLLEVDESASGLLALVVSVNEDADPSCELGDIRVWPPFTLEVLVRDEEDAPVEHAVVDVSPGWTSFSVPWGWIYVPRRPLEHRVGGSYALDRIPAAGDTVYVAAHGFVSTTETYVPPLEEPVRVRLLAASTVEGRVLTVAGEPIPGATVRTSDYSDRPEDSTTTNEEGRFRFDHFDRDNDHTLQATAAGYCIGSSALVAGVERADFRLFREARVSGQVVSAASGTALREAQIHLREAGEESWQEYGLTVDAQGRFELRKLLPGGYELEAEEDEHLSERTTLELAEGETSTDVQFRLEPGLRRTGKVVNAATGEPIHEATVWFESAVAGEQPSVSRSASTERDGTFEVTGLPDGTFSVRASRKGYLPAETSAEVSSLESGTLELALEPDPRRNGAIAGRVLDPDGKPVADVYVTARYPVREGESAKRVQTALADPDGRFRFEDLPPSREHSLQVETMDHLPVELQGIELRSGEERDDIVLRLGRGATVWGQVRNAGGQPAVGVWVNLSRSGSSLKGNHTASDGSFEIKAVAPGEYELTASPGGGMSSSPLRVAVAAEESIEGLELILPGGVHLRGHVLDAEGKPWRGVSLELLTGNLSLTTTSDKRGAFEFSPVPAGRASLLAGDRRGGHAWIAVEAPAEDVTLRLSPTFLLACRLEAPGRTRLPRGTVSVDRYLEGDHVSNHDCTTDETGRFTLRTGPGKLLLAPVLPGFANVRYARSVLAEPPAELVLTLVPAGSIDGIVLSAAKGAPVPAGCFIEVEPQDPLFCRTLEASTGSDGTFALMGVPAGTATVRAWSSKQGASMPEVVRIEEGQSTTVRLQLVPSSGVHGTATLDGEPVAGAHVTLRTLAGGFERSTRTRPSGGFELDGAPAGELELLVQGSGRQAPTRRLVTVFAGEIAWVDVNLRLALLTGRVSRGGEPVADATLNAVWASPGSAHAEADTNERGEYVLEVPAGARIELTVADASGELRRLGVEMPSSGADLRRDIEIGEIGR